MQKRFVIHAMLPRLVLLAVATSAAAPPAGSNGATQPAGSNDATQPVAGKTTAAPAASPELASFQAAIRQLYDMKERAWAGGDAETIVTRFYAPDAVSVGEGDPNTMVGREQFRKAYQQYVRDVSAVRIESVRTVVNGNAGWDWANFYATVKPEKVKEYPPSPVRILFLWSKEHGHWICKGDIFVDGRFANPL